jgi:hypothetical protein
MPMPKNRGRGTRSKVKKKKKEEWKVIIAGKQGKLKRRKHHRKKSFEMKLSHLAHRKKKGNGSTFL